jgi:hypothetical protein
MDTREAMKVTLKLLFELLEEEKDIKFTENEVKEAIETMHDDNTFFEDLLDFFEEHIETFGENYGLEFEND